MYNDFELGAYLLFEPDGAPARHRVFVDPRLPAYPPELHRLLGRGDLTRPEWDAAMDRYGVTSALLDYAGINRRVAWWDPERWALVFHAGDARIFVRRLPGFRALIAEHEIPATFSFTEEEGTATLPLERRPADSPVPEGEWRRRLGDLLVELDGTLSDRARAAYAQALAAPPGSLSPADEARLGAWLGAVELAAGRPADALPLLDRALGAGNRELSTYTDRAAALEALGRREDAAAAWGEVAARAGDSALGVRARARAARMRN
jgi:tetratricopeptide (TPR) repeat protein